MILLATEILSHWFVCLLFKTSLMISFVVVHLFCKRRQLQGIYSKLRMLLTILKFIILSLSLIKNATVQQNLYPTDKKYYTCMTLLHVLYKVVITLATTRVACGMTLIVCVIHCQWPSQ